MTGRPSRKSRSYATPTSTQPTTNNAAETQGLRTAAASLERRAPMRSMTLALATTRRLNTSVTKKMAARHSTVNRAASALTKKWKLAICVRKSEAVKNVMSCERPMPQARPMASAPSETMAVSSVMMSATWPRPMPSTW